MQTAQSSEKNTSIKNNSSNDQNNLSNSKTRKRINSLENIEWARADQVIKALENFIQSLSSINIERTKLFLIDDTNNMITLLDDFIKLHDNPLYTEKLDYLSRNSTKLTTNQYRDILYKYRNELHKINDNLRLHTFEKKQNYLSRLIQSLFESLCKKDLIMIIPISAASHFSVIIGTKENLIHFDSIQGYHREFALNIIKLFNFIIKSETDLGIVIKYREGKCPLQSGGRVCGYHTVLNVENVLPKFLNNENDINAEFDLKNPKIIQRINTICELPVNLNNSSSLSKSTTQKKSKHT